ncbi:chaperonin 10-like protein [Mycena rebaudengoi]|nr:chaperonin 10-like protein [Mycena rebaudengoi]
MIIYRTFRLTGYASFQPRRGPSQDVSVALNPFNNLQREYDNRIDEYPAVLGADIAGVVEKVGEAVQGFFKGDRVFAGVIGGGFQQYIALPAAVIIRMPQNLSFDEVSTALITFTTACLGMFAPAPIGAGLNPNFSWEQPQKGESALVIGASTSTGQYGKSGLTYASQTHIEYLRQLGATEFIDRNIIPVDSLSTVPSLAEKVKVVDDATFAGAIDAAYDCVAQGGAIVTVQPYAPTARSNDTVSFIRVSGCYAGPDVMHYKSELSSTAFGKHIVENLPELFENGVILPNRVEIVANGLAAVPEALERMKAGGVSGVKLVANPQDTK